VFQSEGLHRANPSAAREIDHLRIVTNCNKHPESQNHSLLMNSGQILPSHGNLDIPVSLRESMGRAPPYTALLNRKDSP
jgi:hypothetical protein